MNCLRARKMLWGRLPFSLEEWMGCGGLLRQLGGNMVAKDPACFMACLFWRFTLKVLMCSISCSLTFASYFLLLPSLCLSYSLFSFLCMFVPSPALFGLFISMASISMEASHLDKHIRLNIGLCRKRRNCHSCFLFSGMIYAWLNERERGRWLSSHEGWRAVISLHLKWLLQRSEMALGSQNGIWEGLLTGIVALSKSPHF